MRSGCLVRLWQTCWSPFEAIKTNITWLRRIYFRRVAASVLPIIFKEKLSLFGHPTTLLSYYFENCKRLAELASRLYSLFSIQKTWVKIMPLKLFWAYLSLTEIASRQFVVRNIYLANISAALTNGHTTSTGSGCSRRLEVCTVLGYLTATAKRNCEITLNYLSYLQIVIDFNMKCLFIVLC